MGNRTVSSPFEMGDLPVIIQCGNNSQVTISLGDHSINNSQGVVQISGSNIGTEASIANTCAGQQINPKKQRLLALLDFYGSPFLYEKIERMILDMYGESARF